MQRVGFRFTAMQMAYRHGIMGFVKNMDDSSVYIEAEGEEEHLRAFLQWCKRGPFGSKVEKVEVAESETKGFKAFDIISSREKQS